jgi:hypothetical protein
MRSPATWRCGEVLVSVGHRSVNLRRLAAATALAPILACVTSGALPCTPDGHGDGPGDPAFEECCPGLVLIPVEQLVSQCVPYSGGIGECDPDPSNPLCVGIPPVDVPRYNFVCTKCGDGVCGLEENYCNCPHDCPGGESGPTLDAGDDVSERG